MVTLTAVCLITWAATDAVTALIVYALGLLCYLTGHLYWLYRLSQWLKKSNIKELPNGSGVWEDIFAALYHEQRRINRSKTQLSSALGRFRHAASALPDGVVVLNSDNKIEWCNPPAELQLGLNLSTDENQPIQYLVRHGDFIAYLQSQDYADPIKIKSWTTVENSPEHKTEILLEIKLVPFGAHQKLLICRDVTALEKLESMRRDFIANVSHELRTPLTVVSGFLEILTDLEGAVPASTKQYFGMMQEQTSRMSKLIEDLLALSQIESNAQSPENNEIDMGSLLNMILNDANALSQTLLTDISDQSANKVPDKDQSKVQGKVQAKSITKKAQHNISLDADASLNVMGAAEELHSAFSNLVSNAIRYTPQGGNIAISWHRQTKAGVQTAVFSVKDSGIGIEQKHIDRLTERFYRVDRSRSRQTGGTGLGLSIVKHILTRHQAKLEIKSEIGYGSTFSVVFPKERLVLKPNHESRS